MKSRPAAGACRDGATELTGVLPHHLKVIPRRVDRGAAGRWRGGWGAKDKCPTVQSRQLFPQKNKSGQTWSEKNPSQFLCPKQLPPYNGPPPLVEDWAPRRQQVLGWSKGFRHPEEPSKPMEMPKIARHSAGEKL